MANVASANRHDGARLKQGTAELLPQLLSAGVAMQDTLRNAFIYSPDLTPVVTSITPSSGPLKGGTVLTLQGRGLVPEVDFADYFDGWFLTVPALGPAGRVNATEVSDFSNVVCHACWDPFMRNHHLTVGEIPLLQDHNCSQCHNFL